MSGGAFSRGSVKPNPDLLVVVSQTACVASLKRLVPLVLAGRRLRPEDREELEGAFGHLERTSVSGRNEIRLLKNAVLGALPHEVKGQRGRDHIDALLHHVIELQETQMARDRAKLARLPDASPELTEERLERLASFRQTCRFYDLDALLSQDGSSLVVYRASGPEGGVGGILHRGQTDLILADCNAPRADAAKTGASYPDKHPWTIVVR